MVGEGLHIGIILDGNRRYAKKRHMSPWKGHGYGAEKTEELIEWCRKLNVKELTLYSFSLENFKRSGKEKEVLFGLFRDKIKKLKNDKRLDEKNIRIRFVGRIWLFPEDMQKEMKELMKKTENNSKYTVNFAMAYGGRQEIVDAIKKIIQQIKDKKISAEDINEETITDNLYLRESPDLIIRPGGEKRVSNFLIWQSYYSEWFFTDKLWPEFTKEDLIEAIRDFKARERRYGR